MRERAVALLAVLLLGESARAAPALVRARLQAKEALVGQRVTLVVELLSPTFFANAASFDLPRVPGAVIVKPDDTPTLSNEMIGDDSYTVQRHEFAVYAQRAGTVRIPAFTTRFLSAGVGGAPAVPEKVK